MYWLLFLGEESAAVTKGKLTRALSLHKDLVFGAGDEGGVVVKTRTSSEQSFYLTDDEKSIVIQDLLEELKVILYCKTLHTVLEAVVR